MPALSKKELNHRVTKIANDLMDLQLPYHGLLGGSIGIAIFFDTLFEATGIEKYKKKCREICEYVIEDFQDNPNTSHTIGNGYTGIALGFNYLIKRRTLKIDASSFFKDLDPHIYERAIADLDSGNYDYLHGGSGAAVYALSRLPNRRAASFLKAYVDAIDKMKHIDQHGYKWVDVRKLEVDPEGAVKYNLGLSHGIPSILNVLVAINHNGVQVRKTRDLVEKGMQWLSNSNSDYKTTHRSQYPTIIWSNVPINGESRLAWCYGDLGIAFTYLHAGKAMGQRKWFDHGAELARISANRRGLKPNGVDDAALCHGAGGIAYMFFKFFEYTKDPACREAYEYWLEQTLAMGNVAGGLGGYQAYKAESALSTPKWVNEPGLLEGTTGIGLALLSYYNIRVSWENCLLLKF